MSEALEVPAVRGIGWSFAARVALIYCIATTELMRPFLSIQWFINLLFKLIVWGQNASRALLGLSSTQLDQNEGLNVLTCSVIGIVGATLWLVLDRRRRHEVAVTEAARLMCRYTLASMLIFYGFEKLLGHQGGWSHAPENLTKPFGEMSSVTAMMSWLSYTTTYAWFAGIAEAGAGVLLFSRRLTTLAAWLCLADMGMVWLMNQAYWDQAAFTPVTYIPPTLFLLAPHVVRTYRFFLRNRSEPLAVEYLTPPPWFGRFSWAFKLLSIATIFYLRAGPSVEVGVDRRAFNAIPWSPRGLYHVEAFERNGQDEPLAFESPRRWAEVAIDAASQGALVLRTVDDRDYRYIIDRSSPVADRSGTLKLVWSRNPLDPMTLDSVGQLRYAEFQPGRLTIEGTVGPDRIRARLRRIPFETLPWFRHRWKPI